MANIGWQFRIVTRNKIEVEVAFFKSTKSDAGGAEEDFRKGKTPKEIISPDGFLGIQRITV